MILGILHVQSVHETDHSSGRAGGKRCHFISVLMYISGANFKEDQFNISRDILYSVFSILVAQLMTSSLS